MVPIYKKKTSILMIYEKMEEIVLGRWELSIPLHLHLPLHLQIDFKILVILPYQLQGEQLEGLKM